MERELTAREMACLGDEQCPGKPAVSSKPMNLRPLAVALNTDCTEMREIAPADAPGNTHGNHDPGKSEEARGGKRPGAGRKPNLAKRLLKGFTRDTIARAAADIDVGAVITMVRAGLTKNASAARVQAGYSSAKTVSSSSHCPTVPNPHT